MSETWSKNSLTIRRERKQHGFKTPSNFLIVESCIPSGMMVPIRPIHTFAPRQTMRGGFFLVKSPTTSFAHWSVGVPTSAILSWRMADSTASLAGS